MKRKYIPGFICLVLIISLFSCVATPNTADNDSSESNKVNPHQGNPGTTEQKPYDGLETVFVCEDTSDDILSARVYGKNDGGEYTPLLVVNTKDGEFCHELPLCATYYPIVVIGEFNGDGIDDLLVHNPQTAMGVGFYTTHVFQITKDGLNELYRFPEDGDETRNLGFSASAQKEFSINITHEATKTQYLLPIDASYRDKLHLHDETGNPLTKEVELEFGTFYSVVAGKPNQGGSQEIIVRQNFTVGSLRAFGYVEMTLAYNSDTAGFDVVNVKAEPFR